MIHNNFRKLVNRSCGATRTLCNQFIDIDGNEMQEGDTLTNDSYIKCYSATNYQYTNTTYTAIKAYTSSAYNKSVPYCFIGNSTQNEPSYTLGSIIDNDTVKITTNNVAGATISFVTTLTNTGSTAVSFDEVGLFLHLFGGVWQGVSNAKAEFLLIKEQLSSSITLEAGDSISLNFSIFGDVTIS